MSKDLISVVVPVYGVENYIGECIESILSQSYSDFELLLVDDGSKDRSGEICDEYATKDSRITVYHKANGGLSSARNYGIEHANGTYICFIDSDDWIYPDYLMRMYTQLKEENSDIVLCDVKQDRTGAWCSDNKLRYSSKEIIGWLENTISREYMLTVVAFNKLYRTSLFNEVRYPLGKLHEDEFVIYSLLRQAGQISVVREELYFYRNREDSITGSDNNYDERHLDVLEAYSLRLEHMLQDKAMDELEFTWRNSLLKGASFYQVFANDRRVADRIKSWYIETYNKYSKYVDIKKRIKYKVFIISPKLFCRLWRL